MMTVTGSWGSANASTPFADAHEKEYVETTKKRLIDTLAFVKWIKSSSENARLDLGLIIVALCNLLWYLSHAAMRTVYRRS